MGRTPCCDKNGLKKGPWTSEEDQKLLDYINKHGYGNWRTLPKNAGLQRCGKSCRLRWTNYLRPDIKRGRFSYEEEETIIQLHCILGNKWSTIAARLPGRTDNEIKNYWNTHMRKRLLRMGIDPVTHCPRLDLLDLSSILGNSSLDNTHMNLDLINLATSLFSTANNPNTSCSMTYDFNPNPRIQNGMDPWIQTTQIEAPIVTPISNCATMTTTATCTNFDQNFKQWRSQENLPSYGGIDQTLMDPSGSNNSNFGSNTTREGQQSYLNYELASVMSSTPSSSPPADERDSYCSGNMFMINKFEIPDFIDVNQFILAENTPIVSSCEGNKSNVTSHD